MFFIILGLFGGLGLFLYGMQLASEALQKYSASKIKNIFSKLTQTPAKGVGVGILITFLLQSSSAATVLLVGFVSAGLMSFSNAIGVIMGSAIGTTLTVQLIAFKVTDYALLLVAVGAGLLIFSDKKKARYAGQIILGFGLIFYGMGVMTAAMNPLKDNSVFTNLMLGLVNRPYLLLLVATAFTAIVQSSAATLAIAMSLAMEGVISIGAAIPIMLGANIGTTATALLSSLASSREAKRVALAFLIFKIIGVIAVIPFISPFVGLVLASSKDISRQIANAHTFFNVFITLLFFPVINWLSMLIYKLVPEKEDEIEDGKKVTKFIDENVLDVPDLALWQAKNEIIGMGKLVGDKMLSKLPLYVKSPTDGYLKYLMKKERQVDSLYVEISKYITALAERDLQEDQSQLQVKYLYVINDLEHVGDIVLSLSRGYHRALDEGAHFSGEDIEEFNAMFAKIKENYYKSLEAFSEDNYELAAEVLKGQPEILRLEKNLRFNHFCRMASPEGRTLDSSSTYLDMINDLLRINLHSVSISQTVMGIV
ncbi:Na/Pi cotransporter family protein [Desulfitibacter alkalitolerans]|uniref:Na/Pi cotransporter family protein n=1 Tax=Desulfitibacter alkalitolerans TaxID=264641 RepID=UPI0004849054|nr:Na/Pi cotransporter family protein [Desulfitibacter alkalitolerans]